MHRRLLVAALACVVVGSVACGSTVAHEDAGPSTARGDVPGVGLTPGELEDHARDADRETPDQPAIDQRRAGPAAGPGRPQSSSAARTAAAPTVLGPGVTPSAISIGLHYLDTSGGTAYILGENLSVGDGAHQGRAVADWINRNGGIGGRRLNLVLHRSDYAQYLSDYAGEQQRVCARFTQDTKVLAAVTYVRELGLSCLARADVVSVQESGANTAAVYHRYDRYFYSPGTMSQDRGVITAVLGMAAKGALRGARLGVVWETSKESAKRSLEQALARRGLRIAAHHPVDDSSASNIVRDAGAAVFPMRAANVTHVVFIDFNGGSTFSFLNAAENQAYRPRYILTSNNEPASIAKLVPPEQLRTSTVVSWFPYDVDRPHQEAPPAVPRTRDLCMDIYRRASVDLSDRTTQASAVMICGSLFFLKAAIDAADAPNSAAVQRAVEAMGEQFAAPTTYRTRFGPSRHDGPAVTRLLRFDMSCTCFVYREPGPPS